MVGHRNRLVMEGGTDDREGPSAGHSAQSFTFSTVADLNDPCTAKPGRYWLAPAEVQIVAIVATQAPRGTKKTTTNFGQTPFLRKLLSHHPVY